MSVSMSDMWNLNYSMGILLAKKVKLIRMKTKDLGIKRMVASWGLLEWTNT